MPSPQRRGDGETAGIAVSKSRREFVQRKLYNMLVGIHRGETWELAGTSGGCWDTGV
jgi:hypothetical protein